MKTRICLSHKRKQRSRMHDREETVLFQKRRKDDQSTPEERLRFRLVKKLTIWCSFINKYTGKDGNIDPDGVAYYDFVKVHKQQYNDRGLLTLFECSTSVEIRKHKGANPQQVIQEMASYIIRTYPVICCTNRKFILQ